MPREGPCRVEGCLEPDRSGGQWAYIPEAYCIAHGLTFQQACMCKKPGCARAVGKRGPTQVPGRKRKGGSSSPVTTTALLEEQLPRPPTIVTIDEVWADRCFAQPPLPFSFALASTLVCC